MLGKRTYCHSPTEQSYERLAGRAAGSTTTLEKSFKITIFVHLFRFDIFSSNIQVLWDIRYANQNNWRTLLSI